VTKASKAARATIKRYRFARGDGQDTIVDTAGVGLSSLRINLKDRAHRARARDDRTWNGTGDRIDPVKRRTKTQELSTDNFCRQYPSKHSKI
jgi:hypothetical protein